MNIYTNLVSSFVFPLHEKIKGHNSVALLNSMEQTQWLSSDELKDLQLRRLRELLVSVNEHVPYYQSVFKSNGLRPESINEIADLQNIPFLTKDIIRSNLNNLIADNAHSLSRFNTGGSTGEPLIFYIGKERVSHDVAAKWRATRWWGVDIGDPEIVVWGSPIELGAQDWVRKIRDNIFRSKLIPAFEMSEKNLDEFIKTILKFKPKILFGYPSSLSLIAERARNKGISFNSLDIRTAFVTSEKLYDQQRECIETVFNCNVANGYGGRDAGFIAHECPSGGMHITAEDIVVEIVDENGNVLEPGRPGEIVITHLATKEFPFIRYRTGDIAVLDENSCSCGRGLPMLKEVQGRSTDFIVASDGTKMHGLALIYVIRDLPGISAFKIIQESQSLIRVILVKSNSYESDSEVAIHKGIKERVGQDVEVQVEYVDSIPREKSGKFRYVISRI